MYVRDHARPDFHKALGVDPTEYDYKVFRITSEISPARSSRWRSTSTIRASAAGLERLRVINDKAAAKAQGAGLVARAQALGARRCRPARAFARLYLHPGQGQRAARHQPAAAGLVRDDRVTPIAGRILFALFVWWFSTGAIL